MANYIFPFITFSYVSKVLGINGMGMYNYIDSIINYFILFSMMGINTVGIRIISQSNGDKIKVGQNFSQLFLVCTIFTFFAVLFYIILCFSLLSKDISIDFILLGALKITLNLFVIEWFFKGIEDFKFITLRNFVIKSLYILLVFIFVKGKGDLNIFMLLSVLVLFLYATINWFYFISSFTFIYYVNDFRKSFKAIFLMGASVIVTFLYTSLNVILLGYFCGVREVALYSSAVKIISLITSILGVISQVMLPKVTKILFDNKNSQANIKSIYKSSISIILIFSFPIIIYGECFSKEIVSLILGSDFASVSIILKIMLPGILIVGIEQILVYQIFIPFQKDLSIVYSNIIAAIISLSINYFILGLFKSLGTSINWLICESAMLLFLFVKSTEFVKLRFPIKMAFSHIFYSIPYVLIILLISNLHFTNFLGFYISATFGVVYFILLNVKLYLDGNSPLELLIPTKFMIVKI